MDYQEAIEVINNHEGYVGVKYVNGVEEAYVTPYFEKALNTAISAIQELQEYKQLGTLEEMKLFKETRLTGVELAELYCAVKNLSEYKKLGTLQQVRDAVEKQNAISREIIEGKYFCPKCHNLMPYPGYCGCGQKLY